MAALVFFVLHFNVPSPTAISTLSLHNALPICQTGVAGHLKIGDRASVGAQSGVMHDIPAGEKWLWSPAVPDRYAKRQILAIDRKSTRLNSSHRCISYAVFCLKKKKHRCTSTRE